MGRIRKGTNKDEENKMIILYILLGVILGVLGGGYLAYKMYDCGDVILEELENLKDKIKFWEKQI